MISKTTDMQGGKSSVAFKSMNQKGLCVWTNLFALFHFHAPLETFAHKIASLPIRMGGLGLRSAMRTRFAAYWAACADALSQFLLRFPILGNRLLMELQDEMDSSSESLSQLRVCADLLRRSDFTLPSWQRLAAGLRPSIRESDEEWEPGLWSHG